MKYEEYLDAYGHLSYRFQGTSMMPLLRQGKDTFTVIKKGAARCRKYDIVLYRRGSKYILHRVVKVLPDGYVILGDNCLYKERDIKDENILGILVSFNRGRKEIPAEHWSHQLYARAWYFLYPLRFAVKWLRRKL